MSDSYKINNVKVYSVSSDEMYTLFGWFKGEDKKCLIEENNEDGYLYYKVGDTDTITITDGSDCPNVFITKNKDKNVWDVDMYFYDVSKNKATFNFVVALLKKDKMVWSFEVKDSIEPPLQ